ncbi:PA-phosphatase [Sesbania bispinosa]|nr:PA-phosphatase [Sesbania bispinosa]
MQLLEEKDTVMSHDNGWSEYTMTKLDREDANLGRGVSHRGDCEGKGMASCCCRDDGVREACAPVCGGSIDGGCAVERDDDWICTMRSIFF